MPSKAPGNRSADRSGSFLALVFVVVIGSFLGSSVYAQYASSEIASLSQRLATNVSPSIEDLASIRASTLEAELALSSLLRPAVAAPKTTRSIDDALADLRLAIARYLALPLAPGERPVHDELQQAWARFEQGAKNAQELAAAGEIERARRRMPGVEAAAAALVQASMRAIAFNAEYGQALGKKIGDSRRRTAIIANGLTALSVLLGLMGAVLLNRQARLRDMLANERTRVLEERAAELEQFAGRVAHDIRGPLGAAALATDLLAFPEQNEEASRIVKRLKRSLGRASAITTDLLQFARAGAKPDPGARTSPRGVIANIGPELEAEAASQGIVLSWKGLPPALVACSEGVYLSLIGNLVRNAIKYMGPSATRRITVSVTEDGAMVRTEVADTGPGIAKNQLALLFEPYFRGNNTAGREGLGLGLPTVRKLAEGHGGSVGVWSSEGNGTTFWFTLPRSGTLSE